MKPCVIYHWWSGDGDNSPNHNLRTPIIHSIATLRGCDTSVPIYVLDISDQPQDLQGLDKQLNFNHVPLRPFLNSYNKSLGWRQLSRLFDVRRFSETIPEDLILYSDTDVFWKSSPLPVLQDPSHFAYNGYNSGFFYFYKNSPTISKFFEIFEAYTLTALNDENFRYITAQFSYYSEDYLVFDEAILSYMWNKREDLFSSINVIEHGHISGLDSEKLDVSQLRMIHTNGINVENDVEKVDWKKKYARGLVPLLVEEFYQNLCQSIDPTQVYFQAEIDYFSPLRVSLSNMDFIKEIIQHKDKKGLYDFRSAIKRVNKLGLAMGNS